MHCVHVAQGEVGSFKCNQTNFVHAVVEPGAQGKDLKQETLGGNLVSQELSGIGKVVFTMRWTATGLMPIRPLFIATQDIIIPPAKAAKFWD